MIEAKKSISEESGWDVEHVGDGVFEATNYKEGNWEDDCEDFSGGGFCAESHPDSETN